MLVLSRRVNESIQIGTDIEVMVIDVRGDVVRLGITAPQSTQIWRKELWDIIVEENKAASEAPKTADLKATPQLPLSAFSKLSKIPTVHVNSQPES
ncbi:MAG: carbon storage regulator CsrA [Synergistaceae bacterium]|nr:carbon storage regulator CsrA [Synergistaceae bacterium]